MDKQEGEIVILPDPDTDVRMDNLRNCEGTPLTSAPPWMKAQQQALAKAALRYGTADYEATLSLTPRTPLVSRRTITNVKITSRSIEETVLLNFRIEQAGIRRVAFLYRSIWPRPGSRRGCSNKRRLSRRRMPPESQSQGWFA